MLSPATLAGGEQAPGPRPFWSPTGKDEQVCKQGEAARRLPVMRQSSAHRQPPLRGKGTAEYCGQGSLSADVDATENAADAARSRCPGASGRLGGGPCCGSGTQGVRVWLVPVRGRPPCEP